MLYRKSSIAPLVFALACGGGGDGEEALTREQLLAPAECERCHPDHNLEWIGSSHAYAADDPVFRAMNARFQRETDGQFPGECVRCHAPVALAEGVTTDGLNLDEVPAELRGVTCYACHGVASADAVGHELILSEDGVMLGGIDAPKETGAHESAYSELLARDQWRSTDLCGACHEFQSQTGVSVHRTYTEWTESMFANSFSRLFLTCNGCHVPGRDGVAAIDGPERRVHSHMFPGVNLALFDWPEREAQRAAVEADLGPAILPRVCLGEDLVPEAILDNVMGGHMWPSGDASVRRAWVELVVRKGEQVLFESGVISEGTAVTSTMESDPALWLLSDRLVDGAGEPVRMWWDAAEYESHLLPPSVTADPADPRFYHAINRSYPPLADEPTNITMKLHIRPIGLDLIDDLIDSGDLDAAVRDRVPTFTPTVIEWQGTRGTCEPPLNP